MAIVYNAKAFDLHFLLNKSILLKWKAELTLNELKILCMKMEHIMFMDSNSFVPCSIRKLPEEFGLT